MSITDLPNGRDLGGHRTRTGLTVRTGVAFRSAAPADPDLVPLLADLAITRVYDLRTTEEREQRPTLLPATAATVVVDMLADEPGGGAASLGRIARAALAGDTRELSAPQLHATFVAGYRSFVTLPSARAASREILADLADSSGEPVLFHCTAGKDRTGWIAALVLLVLDVEWDDIMADYLASGPAVAAIFAPYREIFAERGGDLAAMDVAIGVYPEYLTAARDAVSDEFGDLDRYLSNGLGLPPDFRERLAARLL